MVSFIWPGQFDYRMSRVIYDMSLSSNHFVSPNTLLSHIFFIFLVFCFSAFNILQALEKRWPSDSVRIMRQALETHYPLRLWDKLLSKLGTWGKNSRYRQLLYYDAPAYNALQIAMQQLPFMFLTISSLDPVDQISGNPIFAHLRGCT